jgi:hypothetical protein
MDKLFKFYFYFILVNLIFNYLILAQTPLKRCTQSCIFIYLGGMVP